MLLNHSLSGFDSNKSICVTSVYKILSLFYNFVPNDGVGSFEQHQHSGFVSLGCQKAIEVNSIWEPGRVPADFVRPRAEIVVQQRRNFLTQYIIDFEDNMQGARDRELDRCSWVEWVRIVLPQPKV